MPKYRKKPVVDTDERLSIEIDLDKIMWESIQKAAEESNWIPKEYCMNDWVYDVQDFLRNGPQKQGPSIIDATCPACGKPCSCNEDTGEIQCFKCEYPK
jgi:hypothetical protein